MKSIQAKRRPPQSNDVILSDVLIGCGQILLGTNSKAFKCLSEDQPHEGLHVCQALEDFKSTGYLENLNAPNDMIEIIDIKDCKRDRMMYFMGRDPYCEGCEFIGKETDIKKEENTKVETNALMSLMKSDKLMIIPPPHGNVMENCEKVYKGWEAFMRDKDIRQRIFKMVQHESNNDESIDVLVDIFLKYQQLFLRIAGETKFELHESSKAKQSLLQTVVQSQFSFENFQNFRITLLQRDAIVFSRLSEIESIERFFTKKDPLTLHLMNDITQFSSKLNRHCIGNKIQDFIDWEFLNKSENPGVILDFYGRLFNALRMRMGLQTAQCQLPLIRLLYMALQMAHRVRKGLVKEDVQMCETHKNIENIDLSSMEKRQASSMNVLLERLATIFAKGVNQYNQCQHWDYPEKKLFNLYESGVKALMLNKKCSECDLKNLEQVSRLSAEAVLHQPRKETALHLEIDASYQNLLKRLSKKGFDVAVFLKKCKDLLGPYIHESSQMRIEGQYLTESEVLKIQEKIFQSNAKPNAFDPQICEICSYLGLMKAKRNKYITKNFPRLLGNGLTFSETLACLVRDCHNVKSTAVEPGLRLEYARNILNHLKAVSQCDKTDPLHALAVRLELMQPLMEQDDQLQHRVRVIAARLKGMSFDTNKEGHKPLISVLEKIAYGTSFTDEDIDSALVLTHILQNLEHHTYV
eukprot:Gregarina_sp_Poly_1__3592@NODE_2051_length_2760_cov_9_566654_g1322_i0_p1_GENE_NODE_2051_length_2760_cov_9_566654_g1322_i0NODE_2051_length_2760_cov_9_566654_g1322_i0_p1_ORF_typecomplete_len694_score63_86Bromo_TP_like/PF17027_5/0_15Bromo_TP_like/PF17027_5/5_2e02_NODE_2051_length_2760_cov_9_566654_g1322_i03582439